MLPELICWIHTSHTGTHDRNACKYEQKSPAGYCTADPGMDMHFCSAYADRIVRTTIRQNYLFALIEINCHFIFGYFITKKYPVKIEYPEFSSYFEKNQ